LRTWPSVLEGKAWWAFWRSSWPGIDFESGMPNGAAEEEEDCDDAGFGQNEKDAHEDAAETGAEWDDEEEDEDDEEDEEEDAGGTEGAGAGDVVWEAGRRGRGLRWCARLGDEGEGFITMWDGVFVCVSSCGRWWLW